MSQIVTMEPIRVLDFKNNKLETLTLDELRSSVKEEDYNGKPLMGMYHWEFVEKATKVIESAGLNYQIDHIWAAQNQDKSRPGVSIIEKYREDYGEGSVQSHLLRRIFSRILISDEEDEMTNTAIALNYNQMGFQLAFGPNVKICQNLCILGASKLMSTYSSDKKMPSPQRMLEVLGDWTKDFLNIRKRDKKLINDFQEIMIQDAEVLEIIGDMTTKRVRKENAKLFPKEPLNPLNQSQIGKFSLNFLEKRAAEPNRILSAWDVYNIATELYKPGETDFPIILSSNHAMSQYIMDRYSLN